LLVEALVSRIPDLTAIEAALACSVSDEDDLLRTEAEDAAAQARIGLLASFCVLARCLCIGDVRTLGADLPAFRARLARLALHGERSELLSERLSGALEAHPFLPEVEPPEVYHYPLGQEQLGNWLNRTFLQFLQAALQDLGSRLDERSMTDSQAFAGWQRSYYALIYCALDPPCVGNA
jgi:hypothetical protein